MNIGSIAFSLLLLAKTTIAVRGCTVIAIQPDLRWKKAVCDSHSSLLTKVPPDLPEMLISLRVTQQEIRRLDNQELRRLVYLEEFYLDSCQLEQLELNVFQGLNRLRILSLRNNSLRLDENSFLPATLHRLPALEVLDLSENPLGQIPGNFFPTSLGKSLFELRLGHTKNEFPLRIEASVLEVLRNLQILDLSFSGLETLSSDFRVVFNKMGRLKELQLGGNPWHCDCNLRWLREWYLADSLPSMQLSYEQKTKFGTTNLVTPTCKSPYAVKRRLIFAPPGGEAIEPEEFVCKQWIDSKMKHVIATLGSNISLSCDGYTETQTTVVWFRNGLPLLNSSRYTVSQTSSLDFTSYLNISEVRYEDAGMWECCLEDGCITQKFSINVSVKLISGTRSMSKISEAQRQNLVYAGIGVATIFVILAAIALTVFCCWSSHGTDKNSSVSACAARLQRNNAYGIGMSNVGEDARELIGTRVATIHPDSPVAMKSVVSADGHQDDPNLANSNPGISNHIGISSPTTSENIPSACLHDGIATGIASPKFVSLSTATTTTTALSQPASSTVYKPPPHSTMLVATGFSSPSNNSANYVDLYHLPISGGCGTVPLPGHLFAQITDTSNGVAVPTTNNSFLVSTTCPIHGVGSTLFNTEEKQPETSTIIESCPVHGSPASISSKNVPKRDSISYTRKPSRTVRSRSSSSLQVRRNKTNCSSYHTPSTSNARRESLGSSHSNTSAQARYRTLPSRINGETIPYCPIHGQLMSSLIKRKSISMTFTRKSQSPGRNQKSQNIVLDAPYCSSCASTTSSDSVADVGADFEEYSSDVTESPAEECSDSGSSDYIVHSRPSGKQPISMMSLNRAGFATKQKRSSSYGSLSHDETAMTAPESVLFEVWKNKNDRSCNSNHPCQKQRSCFTTQTIIGQPLVITAGEGSGVSTTMISRRYSAHYKPEESLGRQSASYCTPKHTSSSYQQHHSRIKETVPFSSSSNLVTPKSILVKQHHKHHRRPSGGDDESAESL